MQLLKRGVAVSQYLQKKIIQQTEPKDSLNSQYFPNTFCKSYNTCLVQMGNNEHFKSIEQEYPNLSEGAIVKLVSAEKTELDGKQIINWIFRMIPAVQNMMGKTPNPVALVLAVAGVFNVLKTVSKEINLELVRELNDSIKDHVEMAKLYPEKLEEKMVEVNVAVKNRMYRLKELGDNREQMEFLVSLFLFLRSLKFSKKKVAQKLEKAVDGNLKDLKKMITEKRLNYIQRRETHRGRMGAKIAYYDFLYGSNVLSAYEIPGDAKQYSKNVEIKYDEFLRIR